ncbi:MAG: type II toxin-antitoxin system RelE family toxin [Candidatus Anammoxibacter sp.]
MVAKKSFNIIYAPSTRNHLSVIDKKYFSLIRQTIKEQLQFEPDSETKNRKPLKRPVDFSADWEIRFGPKNMFRVFYETKHDVYEVDILAIGVKRGNKLYIGNKEVSI